MRNKNIYHHSEDIHNLTAPREVVPLLLKMIHPKSVLDVGCGIGTWLKVFEDEGITDFLGIDGDHVDRSLLKISGDKFKAQDLMQRWSLGKKYDLVLSLEVAEHLDEQVSDQFVEMLVQHGDVIVFSAAIPGQSGQNHVNEQWPSYWREKFRKHGYYFQDSIRQHIWDNASIDWWYRQNMFLITKNPEARTILNIVHPVLFHERVSTLESIQNGEAGIRISFGILKKALAKWLQKKLGKGTR